jgi:DNA-binding MarR family transcriptional regulator
MPEGVGRALEKAISRKEPKDEEGKRGISLLMNPVRRRLFEYLCLRPCSHLSEISAALGISPNTAKWHLDKLRTGRVVAMKTSGRRILYYPIGLIPSNSLEVFGLLNEKKMRSLYVHLVDHPGSTQSNLAKSLKMSNQTVTRSTQKLERLGLMSKIQDGVYTRYFPSDFMLVKKEENFTRAKSFQKNVLKRLTSEGLKPKVVRRTDDILIAEIRLGPKKGILNISTDPFTTVLARD